MHIIAIDCGASFLKGACFSADGTVSKQLEWKAPPVHAGADVFEPVQITALSRCVQDMLSELLPAGGEAVLCMANEMHGFLLADNEGAPYTDFISWQKEFGNTPVRGRTTMELLSTESLKTAADHTGMALRAGLPSVNLCYLLQTGALPKDAHLHFYALGDYLLRCLANGEMQTHPTNAAASGLYDLHRAAWNGELLHAMGADQIAFPQVGEEACTFSWNGRVIHALPALGDQQAALYGAGLSEEDALSFNLGTGAQVSRLTSSLDHEGGIQVRPYLHGRYIRTIPHLPSGRAMNVYFRFTQNILDAFGQQLPSEDVWSTILSEAAEAPDTEMLVDLSFFSNPVTSHIRGSIQGIGEYDLSLGTLWKNIFRQMAQNFLWAADQLASREEVRHLVFSGGVARRILPIRKIIEQAYDTDVRKTVAEAETLRGLYRYAMEHQERTMG